MYKFLPAPETRAGVLAGGELPDALFARLLASYVETACTLRALDEAPRRSEIDESIVRVPRHPGLHTFAASSGSSLDRDV